MRKKSCVVVEGQVWVQVGQDHVVDGEHEGQDWQSEQRLQQGPAHGGGQGEVGMVTNGVVMIYSSLHDQHDPRLQRGGEKAGVRCSCRKS